MTDSSFATVALQEKYIKENIVGKWKDQNSTLVFRKDKSFSIVLDDAFYNSKKVKIEGGWRIKDNQLILIQYSKNGIRMIGPKSPTAPTESYEILYFSPTLMHLLFVGADSKMIWIARKID
jgi:hypothetical protein